MWIAWFLTLLDAASGQKSSRRSAVHPGYLAEHATPLRALKPQLQSLDGSMVELDFDQRDSLSSWTNVAADEHYTRVSPHQVSALRSHQKKVNILKGQATTAVIEHSGSSVNVPKKFRPMPNMYAGPIGIGTTSLPPGCAREYSVEKTSCEVKPQEHLHVVFDTGSTNLWMASDLCSRGACAELHRHRFNRSLSETFQEPRHAKRLDIRFGTGELKGKQGIEDFHIGPFPVRNQTFGLISREVGRIFHQIPLEGIVGLAFPSMSAHGVRPFFDSVIQQKVLKHNEFAFYFGAGAQNPTGHAHAILWGGVDPRLYEGDVRMIPVTQPHYWAVDLHGFFVGDERIAVKSSHPRLPEETLAEEEGRPSKLIVDSGTTYFTADGETYDEISKMLPAAHCNRTLRYPNLRFELKDVADQPYVITIPPQEYMVSAHGFWCTLAFMRIPVPRRFGPAMLVGQVFLRNHFTVFDRGDGSDGDAALGFARARRGAHIRGALMDLERMDASEPSQRGTSKKLFRTE